MYISMGKVEMSERAKRLVEINRDNASERERQERNRENARIQEGRQKERCVGDERLFHCIIEEANTT